MGAEYDIFLATIGLVFILAGIAVWVRDFFLSA